MSARRSPPKKVSVSDFCDAMEVIAPTGLAQSWDNVGLVAGDPSAAMRNILLCIDLTPAVVTEAIRGQADVVFAYHPPIFRPIASLCRSSHGPEAAVYQCVRRGIAVYSSHTALDAAEGGPNDVLASLCKLKQSEPLEYVDQPGVDQRKLVVFVPSDAVEKVADAIFQAGGGHIGDYRRCSFRAPGQGTFFGGEATHPTRGRQGRMECVDEIRLESIVSASALPAVVRAMIDANPYEQPAFDIYPLQAEPAAGIGRHGPLLRPTTLTRLAQKLQRATGAACVQTVGDADQRIEQAVIVVGAAGSLPFRIPLTAAHVIITGEIRHHDALKIRRMGCTAIAMGHWASERPALFPLAKRMVKVLPGVQAKVSKADCDPFVAL